MLKLINWSDCYLGKDEPWAEPGIYLARVEDCVLDADEIGPYAKLSFCDASTGRFLCNDLLRFTPQETKWQAKLVQLGIKLGTQALERDDLLGRRFFLAVFHDRVEDFVIGPAVNAHELDWGYLSEQAGQASPKVLAAAALAR